MDIEKIKEDVEAGRKILAKLNLLHDDELAELIKDITKDARVEEPLTDKPRCVRTIVNSQIEKIEFLGWDSVTIDCNGIFYNPEHGSSVRLVPFSKHIMINVS